MTAEEGYRNHGKSAKNTTASERPLKRVVIKEEFVALTGDHVEAVILAQLEYWHARPKEIDRYILEERSRGQGEGDVEGIRLTEGWIYKKSEELIEETMLQISRQSMRRKLQKLVAAGWVLERHNPHHRYDQTLQYRLDLWKIREDLRGLGYELQGWVLGDDWGDGTDDRDVETDADAEDHPNIDNGKLPANLPESNLDIGKSDLNFGKSSTSIRTSRVDNEMLQNGRAIPEITSEITSRDSSVSRSDAGAGEAETETSSQEKTDRLIDEESRESRQGKSLEPELTDLEREISEIELDQITRNAEEYASLLYARFEDEDLALSPTLAGQLTQHAMNQGRWETLRSVAERVVKEKPKYPGKYLLASYAREPAERSEFEDRIRQRSTGARIGNRGPSGEKREDYGWFFDD